MAKADIHNLICMEKVDPKRRWIRSDGALYALMLALVLAAIMAGNAISVRWNLPRVYVQLSLYALLVLLAWYLIRFCLTSFRYTLTDRVLAVERIVGKKEKADECVHLSDITGIARYDAKRAHNGKTRALYVGSRRDALAILYSSAGMEGVLLISPHETFVEKLMAQWKKARK